MKVYSEKQKALIYFFMLILGLGLLSVSLVNQEFKSPSPIPGSHPTAIPNPSVTQNQAEFFESKGAIGLAVPLLVIMCLGLLYFIYLGINKLKITFFYKLGLGAGIIILLLFIIKPITLTQTLMPVDPSENKFLLNGSQYLIAPIGEPPPGLIWFVQGLLLLMVFGVLIWLIGKLQRTDQTNQALVTQLDEALSAISGGVNFNDVILNCYLQMAKVMKEEHAIERVSYLTPHEFGTQLVNQGFPKDAVNGLTILFAEVRYGRKKTNQTDEDNAVIYLTEIRQFCLDHRRGNR